MTKEDLAGDIKSAECRKNSILHHCNRPRLDLALNAANSSRIRNKARRTVPENMSDKLYQWEQPGLFRQTACDKTNTTKAARHKAGWRKLPPSCYWREITRLSFLLKSHRETEFYLLNWCAQIAKLASPEDHVSLKDESAVHMVNLSEQVGHQDWLPGKFLVSCVARCL